MSRLPPIVSLRIAVYRPIVKPIVASFCVLALLTAPRARAAEQGVYFGGRTAVILECHVRPQLWLAHKVVESTRTCPVEALSRDGQLKLRVTVAIPRMAVPRRAMPEDTTLEIYQKGRKMPLAVSPAHIGATVAVMWSPNSRAFFALDGQNPGDSSLVRVYFGRGDGFVDDPAFQKIAVQAFREKTGCVSEQPDVEPTGWSPDGNRLYAYVAPHIVCSQNGIVVEMDVARRAVVKVFKPQDAPPEFLPGYTGP